MLVLLKPSLGTALGCCTVSVGLAPLALSTTDGTTMVNHLTTSPSLCVAKSVGDDTQ